MATGINRLSETAVVGSSSSPFDYYLVLSETDSETDSETGPARVDGIVVEEYVYGDDHAAVGLDSVGWSAADGEWWNSAAFSREMRRDPLLRSRIVAARRSEAESVYRGLAGEDLPGETALRSRFHDREPFPSSAPLLFGPPEVPEGYHDRRVYRILFAGQLDSGHLAHLRDVWSMDLAADPHARVAGTARLHAGADLFTWDLRRIGAGVAGGLDATGLDVTALLAGPYATAIGPLLRELTTEMRFQGLIPVTIERFA
ncbi:hypothetical protein Pth03_59860 [Planotetraspora thailandica]|uniref:Uncharacterized protein n=1 Tax=Planotetraspora thailandica TaxID=487172 RepID=A0A8J3V8U4_9ACTN|nr:hypothetical protein [Planotetraspora thailandica]GII57597.1 hypothetical protein Pth03_59860 [Planotetraspora thailandica]